MNHEPSWIDKLVSFFSPTSGAARAQAKFKELAVRRLTKRHFYDAADKRFNDGWYRSSASVNAITYVTLNTLRARARDLVRNNPHAKNALRVLTNNIVGAGIIAQVTGANDSETKGASSAWREWADSPQCSRDERHSFYGLQHLVMSETVESGEVLIRRRTLPSTSDREVPLEIEVLEGDFLDPFRNEVLSNGNFIVQGVEFSPDRKRVAYWIFDEHPGEAAMIRLGRLESQRVPADQVLHHFETLRAGQVRGITWFAPALVSLRDHGDFSDATILRQKLAACITAFVETPEDVGDLPLNISVEGDKKNEEEIRIGAFQKLAPGNKINFPNPPTAASFVEVSPHFLRAVAAGLGITYEALTNDYSQVNFSSARMGWLSFQRNIDVWRWHMTIPHFCVPAFRWWADIAIIAGIIRKRPTAEWTPPRREMIDPTKEVPALIDAVRGGLMSLPQAIRESGDDYQDVYAEIAKSNILLDKLGVVLDSDPRKVQKSGTAQQLSPTADEDSPTQGVNKK